MVEYERKHVRVRTFERTHKELKMYCTVPFLTPTVGVRNIILKYGLSMKSV